MKSFPEHGSFVERLVRQWEACDIEVDVVAPISIPKHIRALIKGKYRQEIESDRLVRPTYMTFSNKKLGPIDCGFISRKLCLSAALRGVSSLSIPDTYYGKFLFTGARAALMAGRKYDRPAIGDLGESRLLEVLDKRKRVQAGAILSGLDGLVCVSERLKEEAVTLGATEDKILVAPNRADQSRFMPMEQAECREALGLPGDAFIVCFVGHFSERKGPLRVLAAIEQLDSSILGIFLGNGPQLPKGGKVLQAGSVPPDQMPLWLNASDVFVLPTFAEGHCNAINEAVACGIPVISSDIPDIRSQVSENTALLVDPESASAIADAIKQLFDRKDLLNAFREKCRAYSARLPGSSRGEEILHWMSQMNKKPIKARLTA